MKWLFSFVLVVLTPMMVCGQTGCYSLDFSISESNFVDSIVIEWDRGQVYVPVTIGEQTYRFLLDTGAGQAVVYDDTPFSQYADAGLILAHDAVGRADSVRMVKLPPMQIGHVTFTGCQATVQQRPVSRRNIDGIVGFDLVNRGLSMKIDVQSLLLVLTDRKHFFDNDPGQVLRYRLNYHVPYIKIKPFGNYNERVLFDTGSRSLYVINKKSIDKGQRKLRKRYRRVPDFVIEGRSNGRFAIGHSGAEQRDEVVFLQLNNLRFANTTFTDLHTLTTQGGSHLGAAMLKYGAVTFCPRKKTLRFQPHALGDTCVVANRQLDIAFVADNGLPAVGLVWEGGEPYQAGFREGDIIVSIDHRPVDSFRQFVSWVFERGREYLFTVVDSEGQQREIRWVRLKSN